MTATSDQGVTAPVALPVAEDEARWRGLVDKVLKGADFERRLVRPTYDGIAVQPLYRPADATSGLPGFSPFARGAAPAQATAGSWDIRQYHANPDPMAVNAQILEDLERGVSSIQLRLVPPTASDLERALDGVLLDLAPVGLQAGEHFAVAGSLLLRLLERRGVAPEQARADLNADPLGAAVAGAPLDPTVALTAAVALAREVAAGWPGITALLADGRPYHAGGASEAQELACVAATAIAYLRALADSGLPASEAARQIGFALAADGDFFLTVAKFRALRRLWARVLEVAQAGQAIAAMRLHAETATRMFSQRDPYVNVLRGTTAAFAAAAGGADSITILPFDHAIGPPSALARRIARNTHLVLQEESYLGRVIDPAGGSWYVESLTEQLAQRAWELVQGIERRGGMLAALLEGWPQSLVAATCAERQRNIATRREPVTGVSEFPDLAEPLRPTAPPATARPAGPIPPIPAHRLGAGFERLRDRSDAILARTGERPRIFLCNLGRLDEFGARATFATNLFEAGGFAVVPSDPLASLEDLGHRFKGSGARQAAICSSDASYAELAAPAARALKQAHCARVHLMGRPDETERAAWAAAGVDAFVHAGADVLETLERAHALEAGEAA